MMVRSRRRPRGIRVPILVAAALLAVVPGTAAAAPRTHTIVMDKLKFGPVPPTLRAGDIVVWVNKDLFRHTATARDGSFNIDLQPAQKGRTVITHGGTIAFFCKYHPGMTGQFVVR